jgi:hypothetical protein
MMLQLHVTLSESQIRPVAKLHVCFLNFMENAATNREKKVVIYSSEFRLQPKISEEFPSRHCKQIWAN